MSDEKIINPNLEPIDEGDLSLAEKFGHINKESLKNKKESNILAPEKETTTEVSSAEKDNTYSKILSKVVQKSPVTDEDEVRGDADFISKKMDAQNAVGHLVDLAMHKGVVHAVKVARHMEDNYVLDMMHDKMISEEFHNALLEKKLISQE